MYNCCLSLHYYWYFYRSRIFTKIIWHRILIQILQGHACSPTNDNNDDNDNNDNNDMHSYTHTSDGCATQQRQKTLNPPNSLYGSNNNLENILVFFFICRLVQKLPWIHFKNRESKSTYRCPQFALFNSRHGGNITYAKNRVFDEVLPLMAEGRS